MKHYKLQIKAGRHIFTFKSMHICEIYEALADASEDFGFELNKDEAMQEDKP